MKKIAFYIMNSKGYYVLENFIKQFGSNHIEYIVSSQDHNIQKDFFNEIKDLSKRENILFYDRASDYKEHESLFPGYKFAIGWRWIINNEKKLIVFHDSLLPKYRGFAPIVNSLINGEDQIGVTALFANKEYDKGNILEQESMTIDYPVKVAEVIEKIEPLYFNLLKKIYLKILDNSFLDSTIQKDEDATYSMWLDADDYYIDWFWNAEKIKRFIDAVGYPYDYAKTKLGQNIIRILEAEVIADCVIENRDRHIGKIIFMKDGLPVIVCREGLIWIKKFEDMEHNSITINFRSRFT